MSGAWRQVAAASQSAAWLDDEEKASAAKAKSVTAPLGKAGLSSDGDPEARVSRIPKTPEREKPKKRE